MSHRPAAGLCDSCAYQKLVSNTRGSTFSMCRRAREDARFAKYPPVPVRRCSGYEERTAAAPVSGEAPGAPASPPTGQTR